MMHILALLGYRYKLIAVDEECTFWKHRCKVLLTTSASAKNCTSNLTSTTSDGFNTGRTILSYEERRTFLNRYSTDCDILCFCPTTA